MWLCLGWAIQKHSPGSPRTNYNEGFATAKKQYQKQKPFLKAHIIVSHSYFAWDGPSGNIHLAVQDKSIIEASPPGRIDTKSKATSKGSYGSFVFTLSLGWAIRKCSPSSPRNKYNKDVAPKKDRYQNQRPLLNAHVLIYLVFVCPGWVIRKRSAGSPKEK